MSEIIFLEKEPILKLTCVDKGALWKKTLIKENMTGIWL